ncbi:MAG: hypothetical protein MSA82_00320, partial [Oscillospiraceae bacterium]|nr:hypothetical protein [Oscillospiraceae bacterium]
MKIRFKLAGIMLIILIIPIIAVYAVYSSKCSKAVTDGQISSLEIINGDRAAYLNEFLEKYIVVQKNFVTDKEVKSFAGNISNNMAEPDELKYVNDLIRDTVKRTENAKDMFIVSDKGIVLAAYDTLKVGTYDDDFKDFLTYST